MVDNRNKWNTLHNVMIENKYLADTDKKEEELGRWDRRTKGFSGTVAPFLHEKKEGVKNSEEIQIKTRRRSSAMLEALVEKSVEKSSDTKSP